MADTTTDAVDVMLEMLERQVTGLGGALGGLIARYEHSREKVERLALAVEEAGKLLKPQDCKGWDDQWCPTSCACWRFCEALEVNHETPQPL